MSILHSLSARGVELCARAHTASARLRASRSALLPPTTREGFFRQVSDAEEILEIGPLDQPMFRGANVSYFDVFDTNRLKERAASLGRDPEGCPEIDFVSPTGDLSVVTRQFDAVVSSHAIEHTPDLVAHLAAVSRLLKPGARYYLAIPDRRYSFDHFSSDSSLEEVMTAHRERRSTPPPSVVEAALRRLTHNVPLRHWLGRHGRPGSDPEVSEQHILDAARRSRAGAYVDVHCWTFTPASFLAIATELGRTGLTGLATEAVHATRLGSLEFYAVLRRIG